jgi:hypothetical protein
LRFGTRGFFDVIGSALGGTFGRSCVATMSALLDERVIRLLGSGVEAGSAIL